MSEYDPDQQLNTVECALIAGVNRRTIVAWINRGDLPAVRLPGARGHYRVKRGDLDEVIQRPAPVKQAKTYW